MSADTASMPPWKLALIERKRRQEEEELERMKEETSRISEMPTWKRELLLKKKHQENSLVFLADRDHDSRSKHSDVDRVISQKRVANQDVNDKNYVDPRGQTGGYEDRPSTSDSQVDGKAVVDEPLIPIEQNPWYRSDHIKKRHSPRSDENRNRIELIENDEVHEENNKTVSYRRSTSDDSVFADNKSRYIESYPSDQDSDTEEVYRPGFVNKLLNKFLHLTSPIDDVRITPKSPVEQVPNRSHSLENILDEKLYHPLSPRECGHRNDTSHKRSQGLGKAVSMDNLYSKQKTNSRTSVSSITSPTSPNSPSFSLARDDIIIVEASHPERESLPSSEEPGKHSEKGGKDLRNLVRDSAPTELPRPNFVSSTRSLFETSVDTLKLKKRKAPLAQKQGSVSSKPTQPVQPIRKSPDSVDSLIVQENSIKTLHKNHQNEVEKFSDTSKEKLIQTNQSTNSVTNGKGMIPNHKPVRNTSYGNGKIDSSIHNVKKAGKSWSFGQSGSEKLVKENVNTDDLSVIHIKGKEVTSGNLSVNNKTHSLSSVNTMQNYNSDQSSLHKNDTTSYSEKLNSVSNRTNKENHTLINTSTKTNDTVQVSNASSIKKRQAPQPPAVSVTADELQMKASTISKSWITKNAEHELEQKEKSMPKELKKMTAMENGQPKVQIKSDPKTKVSNAPSTTNTVSKVTVKKSQGQKRPKKKSGPGSFLIRPASNLVAAPNRYESFTVTKPESDIPVTNIDDIPDDVPFTNIDDIDNGTTNSGPPGVTKLDLSFDNDSSETDNDSPKQVEIAPCRIVFEGAGVQLGKSSLSKSTNKKLKLTFNDDATSTYEYPSEQWLLEQLPPEPEVNGVPDAAPNGELSASENDSSSNLLSNPAIGSSGGLSSYKSKVQVDFQFGSDTHKDKTPAPTRPEPQPDPEEMQIKPANEADNSMWSDSATSDMLF